MSGMNLRVLFRIHYEKIYQINKFVCLFYCGGGTVDDVLDVERVFDTG